MSNHYENIEWLKSVRAKHLEQLKADEQLLKVMTENDMVMYQEYLDVADKIRKNKNIVMELDYKIALSYCAIKRAAC